MDLKEKVAIVTGASSGIGAATARALLKLGMKVVGFARRKERIENLVKEHGGKLFALSVDVTKPEQVLDGFAWVTKNIGPVHVLINSAGVGVQSSVVNGDLESWRKVMDTNFMSIAVTCKEAIRIMNENKINGYIINVNSAVGYYDPFDSNGVMYRSSKCALAAMTENIRIELARMNCKIRITTLSPVVVETEIMEASGYNKEMCETFYCRTPHLIPEDIASIVVYLLATPIRVHISELLVRPTGEDLIKPNLDTGE